MGVCGNRWKWLPFRSCKIWCESVRKKNYLVTKLLFRNVGKSSLGALGLESPHGGAIRCLAALFADSAMCVAPLVAEMNERSGAKVINEG